MVDQPLRPAIIGDLKCPSCEGVLDDDLFCPACAVYADPPECAEDIAKKMKAALQQALPDEIEIYRVIKACGSRKYGDVTRAVARHLEEKFR